MLLNHITLNWDVHADKQTISKMFCKKPQLTKDSGYAWIVLLLTSLSQFVHLGFSFGVVGNLTIVHQRVFGIDLRYSSVIGSVHIGTLMLFGPVAAVLIKKIGCRFTQIFGGICVILGVGLSAAATQPWHVIVLFGVLAGIGMSSCYSATSQILPHYFDRYKYLAFSLSRVGNFLGIVLWPIISNSLFNSLGYSRAMASLCSVHVVHIIAGILFFEPQTPTLPKSIRSQEKISEYPELSTGGKNVSTGDQNVSTVSQNVSTGDQTQHSKSEVVLKDVSTVSLSTMTSTAEILESQSKLKDDNSRNLKDEFLAVVKLPKIWLLVLNSVLWSVNSSGYLILASDYSVEVIGLSTDEAALGITVLGVAKVVGCLLTVLTSSLSFDRLILHFFTVIVFGASSIITPFSITKTMYYTMTAFWGIGAGATLTNLLAISHDFCGAHQLYLVFGLQMMAQGIGTLTLIPAATSIAKEAGERFGLIFIGCCGILGSVAILPVIINKLRKSRITFKRQLSEQTVTTISS